MIEYVQINGRVGHKKTKVSEEEALKMVNKGLKNGKYILIECEDGSTISSAEAVAEDNSSGKKKKEKKTFGQKAKEVITGTGDKSAKTIKEVEPIAGG